MSYRLGGTDGVAIEAAKWIHALRALGHEVTRVAGEGDANVVLEGLAMHATTPPSLATLRQSLDGIDLVIVENIAGLPLNVAARNVLYQALDQRRALFHHHDLAWQREDLAHLDGPRDQASWRHVTINELSRQELAQRGISATTIMNSFDCDPPLGDRIETRRDLNVDDQLLMLLPMRAIPRKNVEGALRLAHALGAVLWLLGPSEEGYGPTLEVLLAQSGVDVRRGLGAGRTIHDAYAASDLVVVPSTWEGFGNPVLESVTHRRPLALYPYRVAQEIRQYGFDFFDLDDVTALQSFLAVPSPALFERNLAVAREHFNLAKLPDRLATLLATMDIHSPH